MTRLIDADALNREIDKVECFSRDPYVTYMSECIANAPTVDALPVRHGNWIRDEFGARCGACGLYAYRDKFGQPWESPYCPICGAKMEERKE